MRGCRYLWEIISGIVDKIQSFKQIFDMEMVSWEWQKYCMKNHCSNCWSWFGKVGLLYSITTRVGLLQTTFANRSICGPNFSPSLLTLNGWWRRQSIYLLPVGVALKYVMVGTGFWRCLQNVRMNMAGFLTSLNIVNCFKVRIQGKYWMTTHSGSNQQRKGDGSANAA
jgi:hypothetical protein